MKVRVLAVDDRFGPARPSVALSSDGHRWLLLNAAAMMPQGPATEPRGRTDLQVVLLTDALPDHASGLLSLRNGKPIDLYATPAVFERLTVGLPVLPVLQHFCGVHWHLVAVAGESLYSTFRIEGWPELEFTALSVGDSVRGYGCDADSAVGDNIALAVRDLSSGRRLFVAPRLHSVGPLEVDWMDHADCVLVARSSHARRSAAADDNGEWLRSLSLLHSRRKVLLNESEAMGADLDGQGLELAYDGMEIDL